MPIFFMMFISLCQAQAPSNPISGSSSDVSVIISHCRSIKKTDRGNRILAESVYDLNRQLLQLQKMLKRKETQVAGKPDQIDLAKNCECLAQKKMDLFGPEIGASMTSFDHTKYSKWLRSLPPQKMSEHILIMQELEVACYNSSLAK
jgi:hypothetical protein